jgi:hypothetical protein
MTVSQTGDRQSIFDISKGLNQITFDESQRLTSNS